MRSAEFDLAKALANASFTPARRDAPALVDLVVEGEAPTLARAVAAMTALGDAGRRAIEQRLAADNLEAGAHARLIAALGECARRGDMAARAGVFAALAASSARIRRAAIHALGNLSTETPEQGEIRRALLARWDASDVPADERRALTDALGKLGGSEALQRLRALTPGSDADLARRRDRALLIADRTELRREPSEVLLDVAPIEPIAVRLTCKAGLAHLLVEELRALGGDSRLTTLEPRANRNDAVDVVLAQPWSALFASRLWITAGIRIARPAGEPAGSIASAIVAQRAWLAAWTRGPVRWRLDVPRGKQRALIWRVAREVSLRAPELVNDPTATIWDIALDDSALELRPRRIVDPRFAYRVADVPAASHPTVAAALARLGEARSTDRVWDPFVGSGLELIERAKLGPAQSLAGTDVASAAIAAARVNLDAANATASLSLGDARQAVGDRDLDLVITNPPLGSRVQLNAARLLVEILPVIARRLAPGGRLVWITPAQNQTAPVAKQLNLRCTRSIAIDLGGVRGHLERWDAMQSR